MEEQGAGSAGGKRKRVATKSMQNSDSVDNPAKYVGIPARERQVLELLLDGVEPKQIARRLCIKWTTVRTYVANLRRRFGATSVQQLVVFAIRERDGNLLETRQNDDCDERERDIK